MWSSSNVQFTWPFKVPRADVVMTGLSAMVLGPSPEVPPLKRVVVTRGAGVGAGEGEGVGPNGLVFLPQPGRTAARIAVGISSVERRIRDMTSLLSLE